MERELPYHGLRDDDPWAGQRPLDEPEVLEAPDYAEPALGGQLAVNELAGTLPGAFAPDAPPARPWGTTGFSAVDDTHPTNDTPADHMMATVDPDYLEDDEP